MSTHKTHTSTMTTHSTHNSLFDTPLFIDVEVHSSFSEFTTRNPQSHNPNVFESIQVGKPGERKINRCIVCVCNLDTVKRFCFRVHKPATCTTDGAITRPDTISNDFESK